MPRKPKFNHPVRQVRTCLGLSQQAFAKRIGCSAIAIQRIENGKLKLSRKLAYAIAEATAAKPASLLAGNSSTAKDQLGNVYSKKSLEFMKRVMPVDDRVANRYFNSLLGLMQLLMIASRRAGKFKTYPLIYQLQQSFLKLADDFDLVDGIYQFLKEQNSFDKRKYRVSDLRKFPDYARILEFKDSKRFKPDKVVEFSIVRGWIKGYLLHEVPALPHGADMKMPDAEYYLDADGYIPPSIKEAIDQALYWEIKSFTLVP